MYKSVENTNSSVQKVDGAANNILDDILIMTILVEELIVTRDIFSKCLIYLLQGFWVSSLKKPVLQSCQTLEILGVEIHSKDMILTLPEEKNSGNSVDFY